MNQLIWVLVPIACGCILPIFAIWMGIRKEINETNTRTQIALAAIEKNPDMDLEELMEKISPKKKLLKEKLLSKLQAGTITTLLGIAFLGYSAYLTYFGGSPYVSISGMCLGGVVLLGVGIALLINYNVGKKMLAKEIEAEQNKLLEQE
ncbi:MAG: hypothetical protein IKX65_10800 [Prevotella sp.]|nr:hypothetical protein [Prevotella sp.]